MRIFAGEWVKSILDRLGMQEGERIESRMVTRRIEAAQKKVEERNFEVRKNLLEYDEVMDEQRKRVYGYRQRILDGANCRELILKMIREQITHHVKTLLDRDFGLESFAAFASSRLGTPLEAREFRGMDFNGADTYAKDLAERAAESDIQGQIDECLPDAGGDDEEEDVTADWNWEALAKFANTRWNVGLRDRDLKKIGRDGVAEELYKLAHEAIRNVDLSEGTVFLEESFGVKALLGWVRNKFGIELALDEVRHLEPELFEELIFQRARAMYDEKELEYPVMAGLYTFTTASASGGRIDRDRLVAWARERFDVELDLEDLKSKQRDEIRALLLEHSRAHQEQAGEALTQVKARLESLLHDDTEASASNGRGGNGALTSLSDWLRERLKFELSPEDIAALDRDELERKVFGAVEDRYHPEMRRMERGVLLSIVDTAWKDHLLTMDYLRSAVSLKGYAQLDPKVEYKREGMRLFEQMWRSIGERTTDLVFRMERLDEGFVRETWADAKAVHQEAQSSSEIAQQQQEAIDASQGDGKIEPIRNRGKQVGRNDPCPCGSGKKYKACCMRKRMV
jgi:preprotein translocase subunit SecA